MSLIWSGVHVHVHVCTVMHGVGAFDRQLNRFSAQTDGLTGLYGYLDH